MTEAAPRSFHDVVVVGGRLGVLAAGALLARRGFRVACVRHDELPNTYHCDGIPCLRAHDALPFVETPAARRIFSELALAAMLRRHSTVSELRYQVALPAHRVDVHSDRDAMLTELAREFPEVRRAIVKFYDLLDRAMGELDALFGGDRDWPPDGFLARRSAARAAAATRLIRSAGGAVDLLADFPTDHPFRTFVHAQARLAMGIDPDESSSLRLARAHGQSLRATPVLEGGRDAIAHALEDKIRQYGGEVRVRDRVARILTTRGRVTGVDLATTEERLGCAFVLTSLDAARAFELAEHAPTRGTALRLLACAPRQYRFALNAVIETNGIPPAMARHVVAVLDRARPLSEENLLALETLPVSDRLSRITAVALLPRAGVDEGVTYLRQQRARILGAIGQVVPFLRQNLRVVDSPHDDIGPENTNGTQATSDRAGGIDPMSVVIASTPGALADACALPIRSELPGLLLAGPQTLPGLGEEGEMLAALTAARMVTRTDRTKERLRRELWSKSGLS